MELVEIVIVDAVMRHLQLGVGEGIGEIEEEGMGRIVLYELQGVLMDQIGGIGIAIEVEDAIIGPEMIGVVVMGEGLAVVAEEFGEAFFFGNAGRAGVAEAPFAEGAGGVAVILQDGGDGEAAIGERVLAFGLEAAVAADGGMTGVEAGHEACSAGSADGGAGIELGEAHALGGEVVDVWGVDVLLTLVAGVAIAEVVGEDEDYVRVLLCAEGLCCCEQQEQDDRLHP